MVAGAPGRASGTGPHGNPTGPQVSRESPQGSRIRPLGTSGGLPGFRPGLSVSSGFADRRRRGPLCPLPSRFSPVTLGVVTHQPPYRQQPANPAVPSAVRPGWFRRLQPGQRVGVLLGGILLSTVLLCCGGAAVVGALADEPWREPTAVAAKASPPVAAPEPTVSDPAPSTAAPAPTASAPSPSPSTASAPTVQTRTETETQTTRYAERTVNDSSLAEGKRVVRTRGVNGVRMLTYQVTLTDGVPTGRKLLRSVVTKQPVTQVVAVGTKQERRCDPNYSGCVPIASDVDCAGGGGNGPAYVTGPVKVIGDDIYDLDRDNDGYGCDD
uniref:G5 domain-containing protein n=1 Tax=Micromonospora carbonacea TaxID=47853 RepID=A0A7D5YAJ3_9ACTN|nr:G5 domain-containing protein [Micromonospora carbonacea]